MIEDEQEKKEAVQRAYSKLAQRRQNWPNKYNIGLQLSKMLVQKFCQNIHGKNTCGRL